MNSKNVKKVYYPIVGTRHIEVSLDYRLGGRNYFTGQNNPRGYYVNVLPVERVGNSITFMAFSGYSVLIHTCGRRSEGAAKTALSKVKETKNVFEAVKRVLEKETAGFMFDEFEEKIRADFA